MIRPGSKTRASHLCQPVVHRKGISMRHAGAVVQPKYSCTYDPTKYTVKKDYTQEVPSNETSAFKLQLELTFPLRYVDHCITCMYFCTDVMKKYHPCHMLHEKSHFRTFCLLCADLECTARDLKITCSAFNLLVCSFRIVMQMSICSKNADGCYSCLPTTWTAL